MSERGVGDKGKEREEEGNEKEEEEGERVKWRRSERWNLTTKKAENRERKGKYMYLINLTHKPRESLHLAAVNTCLREQLLAMSLCNHYLPSPSIPQEEATVKSLSDA